MNRKWKDKDWIMISRFKFWKKIFKSLENNQKNFMIKKFKILKRTFIKSEKNGNKFMMNYYKKLDL